MKNQRKVILVLAITMFQVLVFGSTKAIPYQMVKSVSATGPGTPYNPFNNRTSPFTNGTVVNPTNITIPEEIQTQNSREVKVEFQQNLVVIDSDKLDEQNEQNEQNETKIKYNIHYNSEELETQILYYPKSSSPNWAVNFRFRVENIIEYLDSDQNMLFEEELDQILQTYELTGFYLANYTEITLETNHTINLIQINSSDDVFSTYFYISEQFVAFANSILTPSQIKIDFSIINFPYLDENSRLALNLKLIGNNRYQTQHQTYDEEKGFASNESAIDVGLDSAAYFSWQTFAYVDGISTPVYISNAPTSPSQRNELQFYLNYEQGAIIFHDPKLGIKDILDLFIPGTDSDWTVIQMIGMIFVASTVLIFGLMMTKQEYRNYLLNRVIPLITTPHRLSMEEVLENESRTEILNLIIDDPGIHYSELLRQVDTSASNIAWHLDILETYKIIHKQRICNYLIFYPFIENNPFAEMDPTLVKSKTTMEVFKIIGDNPGTFINKIALRLDLHRKTVKYHIDKLIEAEIIEKRKDGRKWCLFVTDRVL
jgi:DNA-binding transcriptional ArsR family regulator